MQLHRRAAFVALLAALLAIATATTASAQTPPTRLRGTITARDGDALTIAPLYDPPTTVALTGDTAVTAIIPAHLTDIKPGSFIGTAALPGANGTLIAIEVHVFPESMRGAGEGHRPYDLQPDSSMTNGTVGDVTVTDGRMFTVSYKGGTQQVMVPANAPVVTFEPGRRDQLVPGAHVIVFATKAADGALHAVRVLVGKDGLVPPM